MKQMLKYGVLWISAIIGTSMAFTPPQPAFVTRLPTTATTTTASTRLFNNFNNNNNNNLGGIEQIEFKIYPDGRIEETVRGIRGNNCHHVTEAINEKLGEVVASVPTEELYEQEVVLDQTLIQTTSEWTGSSSSW